MTHNHEALPFNRAFLIAVILNLSFTIVQIIAAFIANSMSLMADAVHNFGDVFGLMLAWGASWLLTLPPRKRYSYGFKKTTILAALANAILLVGTSFVIAYESINKLINPNEIHELTVIIVASIGIIINGGTALLFLKGSHGDLNIKGAFLHLLSDALISFGVVISALLVLYTGKLWIDPLMGLIIVAVILFATWGLLRDSVRLILDAVPRHIDYKGIELYLNNLPGVKEIHDLHIWGLSTKEIALTAHLVMPENKISDKEFKNINDELKHKFRVDHATLQIEEGCDTHKCISC